MYLAIFYLFFFLVKFLKARLREGIRWSGVDVRKIKFIKIFTLSILKNLSTMIRKFGWTLFIKKRLSWDKMLLN